MDKVEIRITGVEAIKRNLMRRLEGLKNQFQMRLMQLAEEAVTYSKEQKGYKDRTANLKNTISFALFRDGELVTQVINQNNELPPEYKDKKVDAAYIEDRLKAYYSQPGVVAQKGFTLCVVAPMNYAEYVEQHGYNVLYLTKPFLHDRIIEEWLAACKADKSAHQ